MSKMTRLSDFPPSLLSRITRLLQFEDLLRVMMLTGDKAFLHRCTNLGGVLELVATTERSIALLASHLPQLPTFSHLTHVEIVCSDSYNPIRLEMLGWHLALPQTLLSLEIRRIGSFSSLLLRPLQDNDDVFTVTHCSEREHTTESMKDRFPNLHTLIIESSHLAPYSMQEKFINDLPDTLTCLDIGAANNLLAPPLLYALYKYDSQDCLAHALAHFTQCRITTDNVSSYMKDATPDALFELVAPLMHLTSLDFPRLVPHPSNDLIQYLTNLQELSFDYTEADRTEAIEVMPLPTSLTALTGDLLAPQELAQLFEYVPHLPNLTSLQLRQFEDTAYENVTALPSLPTKLRTLVIHWPIELPDNALNPFPVSLTHLEVTNTTLDLTTCLRDLVNLRTLAVHHIKFPLKCLPRSLTQLQCFFSCELYELAHLPSSIRKLSGLTLNMTRDAYKELTASTPLRGWSQAAFSELLRLRFPNLKDVPDIEVYMDSDCAAWIGANTSEKTPWTDFTSSSSMPEPIALKDPFIIPHSVTSIEMKRGQVRSLPRGLLHLKGENNMNHMKVPFIVATPSLQTLQISFTNVPPLNWIDTLPRTLTSLGVKGYPLSHSEIDVSSLTALKRLSIRCCCLDLGHLQPILPHLEHLEACIILRPGLWTTERLEQFFASETSLGELQWYQCCLSFLPRRFRHLSTGISFLISWNSSVAQLFPRHITSFMLPNLIFNNGYPTTIGLLGEPNTWANMTASAMSYALPSLFPPDPFSNLLPNAALTSLDLRARSLSAQDYASLPRTLLYLSLSFDSTAVFYSTPPPKLPGPGLDKARIESLPPKLVSLSLRGGYIDLSSFHLMPASLISLKLATNSVPRSACNWELLPKTLRFLEVHWLYPDLNSFVRSESKKILNHLPLLERLLGYHSSDMLKFLAPESWHGSNSDYYASFWTSPAPSFANL